MVKGNHTRKKKRFYCLTIRLLDFPIKRRRVQKFNNSKTLLEFRMRMQGYLRYEN
ncbi:hypothetical protein RchiOBHm_Chr5g0043191 [Rosa chinensis]|uniref:Uncharacterized protein n=1 Tax=Rosa chinensis TaxID=74649 RepID=A0A2P6QDA6_ROSCH|nr:hypothetical protein RchiOBHm_Chr5g0043191 [Rosa chinensis]